MFITLPLTILGIGLLVYYLFGAATHALPIIAGLAAGFAAAALDLSAPVAMLIGAATAFVAIAAGRFAGLTARGPVARGMLVAIFAIPAVIAGDALGGTLANLAGFTDLAIMTGPLAGLGCGITAVKRLAALNA